MPKPLYDAAIEAHDAAQTRWIDLPFETRHPA